MSLKTRAILSKLKLPVIVAPMFLVSGPELVIASCKAGLLGTFPALNARSEVLLDEWITKIKSQISPVTHPFGINLIVHKTNKRLEGNLAEIVKHKVPVVITSLGAVKDVVDAVHSYGGVVYHDVTNIVHARKAALAGVDGLVAVCAGAGGHAGLVSPMAIVPQLRAEFKNELAIACAGAIGTGGGIRAAECLGADFAYLGTKFISTAESSADQDYKEMCTTEKFGPSPTFLPIVYTDKISGVPGNFLRKSLELNGLGDIEKMKVEAKEDFSKLSPDNKTSTGKAWKYIWSAGHGVVNMRESYIPTVADLTEELLLEYQATFREKI